MRRIDLYGPIIAMALLGAMMIVSAELAGVPPALHTGLQIAGIALIAFAIEWRFSTASRRLESGLAHLAKEVDAVLVPERERLGGITRVYPTNREALDEYFDHLRSSTRRADMLQLSADVLIRQGRGELRSSLERGVHIRLLVLDPLSPFVPLLDHGNDYLRDELHESIEYCQGMSRYPNFEFRLYQEPQPFNIYVLEEYALLVPRLPLRTHRGLALHIERGPIFANLEDVFEATWAMSGEKEALQRAIR